MSKTVSIFSFILLFCWTCPAHGLFDGDFSIEKHFLEEENFLDWKAYQPPVPWRYDWYETSNGLKINIGSFSQERFYWHNEIRFQIDFSEAAAFLYELEEDEVYKDETAYQEAEFRFGKEFAFSLIGFPAHDKRYINLGFSLSYNQRASLEYIRFSFLRTHSAFNEIIKKDEKVSGDDEYLREPSLSRLEVQYLFNEKLLLELDLKYESHIKFLTPDENLEKSYKSFDYLARLDWHINQDWLTGLSLRSFKQKRGLKEIAGFNYSDQMLNRSGFDIYGAVQFTDRDHLTFGFMQGAFGNTIDSNDILNLYETSLDSSQLYCVWLNSRSDKVQVYYSLQAGTYSLFKEDEGILDDEDDGFDMKAGFGVVIAETGKYRFLALSTWDLDLFTTRQWDGGSMQFLIKF